MNIRKILPFLIASVLAGCAGVEQFNTAKLVANQNAEQMTYKPVEYVNKNKKGPALIVIPGSIKSNNATFTQRYFPNNIADFGEIELTSANFQVYERADLGPALDEIALAANLGDPAKVQKILKRGKFKTTKWFVKFDILKAEQVAEASTGGDFSTIGNIIALAAGSRSGAVAGTAVGSVDTAQTAGVWLIGMRYKVIDANTTEQVTGGYFEEKMEVGATDTTVLGFRQGQAQVITLDTMIQRLAQKAVADLDTKK
jgi:curli biogenesis system outer membrane secretion channel CsgG